MMASKVAILVMSSPPPIILLQQERGVYVFPPHLHRKRAHLGT